MPEVDDFDIVRDEDEQAASRSTWMWVGIVALVGVFAFGVGAAVMVINSRLGDSPSPTAIAGIPTGEATETPEPEAASTVTATLTLTATLTATLTVTPTETPTSTPMPECPIPVADSFAALYDQGLFGCARGAEAIVWAAWQPFQRGSMLWRSDNDQAYVFLPAGQWFPIQDRWDGGASVDRGAPPPGLFIPERGFGYVWSRSDDLFNSLGWATDREKGFCAAIQVYETGFMLVSSRVPNCTAEGLYNHASAEDWSPLLVYAPDSARRQGSLAPATPIPIAAALPNEGLTRPAAQGLVHAPWLTGITLDADFGDWPGAWQPISAIVHGIQHYSGPDDLAADFQLGWNESGLLFAVRVTDDVYRPGPGGSNLWRGDSIEIHFDRRLAEDFTRPLADADDYQIGIAFDRDLTSLRGYRWLPFALETAFTPSGAVHATSTGYHVEVMIPWQLLEETRGGALADEVFGFNISISDNDDNRPEQQTVLSFSPARTTHDNPTEWATLRLLP